MGKFKPGDWVEYKGIAQIVDLYQRNQERCAYLYYPEHRIMGDTYTWNLTPARPRVELKDGKVWKIHHPNPHAKWVKVYINPWLELIVYDGEIEFMGYHAYSDRPTAIRTLKRWVMRLGISVEVIS